MGKSNASTVNGCPTIEVQAVQQALGAMLRGRELPLDHPLSGLLCVQMYMPLGPYPISRACRDVAIFEMLTRQICRRLRRLRAVFALVGPSRHDTLQVSIDSLKQDFAYNSYELEVWSLLYYRYVRFDLGLSVEQMCDLSHQERRSLQRRQRQGLVRLTHDLIRYEHHLRSRDELSRLRAALSSPVSPRLIGRDREIELGIRCLTRHDGLRQLAIWGQPGTGKSSLALTIAHRLIDTSVIRAAVWIDRPQPSLEWLTQEILARLGCDRSAGELMLSLHLQQVDTLIVLDGAQSVVEDINLLCSLQRVLGAARVVVCIEHLPIQAVDIVSLPISPLPKEAAFALMERDVNALHPFSETNSLPRLESLFERLGGNAKALRTALAEQRRSEEYRVIEARATLHTDVHQRPASIVDVPKRTYPHGYNVSEVGTPNQTETSQVS